MAIKLVVNNEKKEEEEEPYDDGLPTKDPNEDKYDHPKVETLDGEISTEEKFELSLDSTFRKCTLNGEDALICGIHRKYALIRTVGKPPFICAEFSWWSVRRILLEQEGNFKSNEWRDLDAWTKEQTKG